MYENTVAKILFIIGVAEITIGVFVGVLFGFEDTGFGSQFGWTLFFIWSMGGFILGMLFIGFAENIQLLQRIYLKMGREEPQQSQQNHVGVEEIEREEWYLSFGDREKVEDYYKKKRNNYRDHSCKYRRLLYCKIRIWLQPVCSGG